ncbi:mucin-2 isoform X2 [Takifugu flavidus]|uniref:mucin-2 isoform X2 n=1 Tax=Takifugu flavidus TaxID=433684 RepID=UPI0025445452|nr:mucin-2 isoform X2 [Takifugu flavidus]
MSQKPLWDQYRRQQSLWTANCTETTKMNLHLSSLVLIWLLTPCGAVTTEQNVSLTTPKGRVATQEAHTSGPRLLLPDPTTDEQRSAQTLTPAVQTGAAATFPPLPELSDSTRAENATTGQQADVPMQPGTPATAATTPMETSSSTSIPTTLPPSTSIPTTLPPSTSIPTTLPPGTTASMSTQPTIIRDVQPTAPSQTTPATTKRTLKDIRPEEDGGRPKKEATKEANHSTVVAWVIGATLFLMMVSFLVIYIRKRKLNEQQITIKNWAGPSPFIEDGEDNGQIRWRPSNRISLSSFLPQSLSRRLSLLPETDEEMEDINPGTTFGDRREGAPSDQQGAGRDVEGSAGAAADAPEAKTTNGVAEKENCVRAASPTTTAPGDLMAVSLTDDFPANGVGETAQG